MKWIVPVLIVTAAALAVLTWRYSKKSKAPSDWPPEVIAKARANKEAREMIRGANPELFKALSDVIFNSDPIGINFTTNTDEYEPEVGTILPRLSTCKTEDEVTTIVHEEFCKWFGPETAGSKDKYRAVSKDIWRLWTTRAQPTAAAAASRGQ